LSYKTQNPCADEWHTGFFCLQAAKSPAEAGPTK